MSSSNPVYRLLAKGSLVNSGDKAVPFLLKALEEEDVQTKIEVAQVLGFIGNPKAIDPLIKLFDHEHWRVRFFSIDAFRDLKAKKIIPKLKSKIVHDENNDVRLISLLVLGEMEEFDDIEFLKSLLENKDQYEPYFPTEVNKMIKKIESRTPH